MNSRNFVTHYKLMFDTFDRIMCIQLFSWRLTKSPIVKWRQVFCMLIATQRKKSQMSVTGWNNVILGLHFFQTSRVFFTKSLVKCNHFLRKILPTIRVNYLIWVTVHVQSFLWHIARNRARGRKSDPPKNRRKFLRQFSWSHILVLWTP